MNYKFTEIEFENFSLEESESIHPCLLKNNNNEFVKALEFLKSDEKFLYIHGFLGTGKRQFVNYVCEYLAEDVIKLEYFCKESTVCDDILISFTDYLEANVVKKNSNLNAKIATLMTKFQQLTSSLKKPILIVLHTVDNILPANWRLICDDLNKIVKEPNVKLILTTHAMRPGLLGEIEEDKTLFLKAFTKEIFEEFLKSYDIEGSDKQFEDLYSYTRGYYYYSALSVKIMQSLKIPISEFIRKIKGAETSFDSYLGEQYITLIPTSIRNYFWFLKAMRHGISLNALAVLDVYDEFSIEYLKKNLLVFQNGDNLYLHDYFAQNVAMLIPQNTEVKLHKYIIGIYEEQLKENLKNRVILLSRQALRQEIEYHSRRIHFIETGEVDDDSEEQNGESSAVISEVKDATSAQVSDKNLSNLERAKKMISEEKYTEAIEKLIEILDTEDMDSASLLDVRLTLARTYANIGENSKALHYFELAESYYRNNKEFINLNYLLYEMTDVYYKMYKHERAIETIKQVIYSVDTPQSLMVSACTLLGNIYSDLNNPSEAFNYYQKALDSLDENIENKALAELYFKFALANDDKGNFNLAYEYYNRCVSITQNNDYLAPAYSNLASCYYESGNYDDALNCFMKAYEIEKSQNNYDGLYYTSSHIAKIYCNQFSSKALDYLIEAKQSAEFVDEPFYIVNACIALGDYYYNIPEKEEDALKEYFKAKQTIINSVADIDISNVDKRIEDMKLRLPREVFAEISKKYGK